jgi:hypothetical protein
MHYLNLGLPFIHIFTITMMLDYFISYNSLFIFIITFIIPNYNIVLVFFMVLLFFFSILVELLIPYSQSVFITNFFFIHIKFYLMHFLILHPGIMVFNLVLLSFLLLLFIFTNIHMAFFLHTFIIKLKLKIINKKL